MSRLTHEDQLVRALLPAVRATRPAETLRRNRAVDKAISPDGFVQARALLASTNEVFGGAAASNTVNNASTTGYLSYISRVLVLPEGLWTLYVWGALTGTLSGTSNLNSQMLVNGQASSNYQIPLTSTQIGTTFPELLVSNVPGGSEASIDLQFRPSAGTATIEAGHMKWRAERIG